MKNTQIILPFLLNLLVEVASINILQLGDSYSSGNGAGGYYDDTCYRSERNWGNTAASLLGAVSYNNQACSGGVVADLTLQSNAINENTDLILLGIGGNDLGFEDVVKQCFIPTYRSYSECMDMISFARNTLPIYESSLQDALINTYGKMRSDAKIVLVQYPHITLEVDYNADCCGFIPPNRDIIEELITLGLEMDEIQESAIASVNDVAGIDFVSSFNTKNLFQGHEPDPNSDIENPNRWIYEWGIFFDPLETYHLNPTGHTKLGEALVPYLQELFPNFQPDDDCFSSKVYAYLRQIVLRN